MTARAVARTLERGPARRPRWAIGVATALGLLGAALVAREDVFGVIARRIHPAAPMPVYGQVPAFRLLDEQGSPFTRASLAGHTAIVDFVFTRCPTSCPRLTARMGELQARLARSAEDVRLVSFSVDPENDTPPVLARYAAQAHADPARWTFVTGPVDEIQRTVVLGFKVSAAKIAKTAGDYDVVHGDWFVLVDRAGQIRGYYGAGDALDVDALLGDAARLEAGGQALTARPGPS